MSGSIAMTELNKPSNSAALASCGRIDSCLGEPEEELVNAINEDNLRVFSDLLSDDNVNVGKEYQEHNYSTVLHMTVSLGKVDFVKELLRRRDVNPNYPHRVLKQFPIHVAAEQGRAEIVQLLLNCGADVNAKMENGSTALHIAAVRSNANWATESKDSLQQQFLKIVKILLAQKNVNIDCLNNIGVTPLFFAAEKGTEGVIKELLNHGACITIEVDDETAEDLIQQRFPDLLSRFDLDKNRQSKDTLENQLFHLLYNEVQEPGKFRLEWEAAEKNNNKVRVNSDNGSYTFLQYCCDLGYDDLVNFLLEKGADPNLCSPNYKIPPLVLAGHHGYYKIVKLFKEWCLKRNLKVNFAAVDAIKNENILHKVIKRESKAYINYEHRSYDRCMNLLLDENYAFRKLIQPAVNAQDTLGNTPLHDAAQLGHQDIVRKLLRCEANIGIKNHRLETPIKYIAPGVMEEYLDDCLGDTVELETFVQHYKAKICCKI